MNDEARALRWAQKVWRDTPPSDVEIGLGVDRVARRFAVPRRSFVARNAWWIAGATAAVLGAIPFATRAAWLGGHASPPQTTLSEPRPTPAAPEGKSEAPLHPESLDGVDESTPLPAERASDVDRDAPTGDISGFDANHRGSMRRPSAASSRSGTERAWIDVSNALASHDYPLAEKLLLDLSTARHDPSTRAKAHLGLAQLEEARGECEPARRHARYAASIPDVDIKTVRRALELAARCER
jgi:hypothetical protein